MKKSQISQDLLDAYVGNNYRKITTRHYNIAAFFFGGFYLMYRKMLWPGVILLIVDTLVFNLAQFFPDLQNATLAILILSLAISFALCFTFNYFYLQHAHRRMAKLKADHPGVNAAGLKTIYAEKGGTSGGFVFGGIGILILISIVFNLVASALGLKNNPTNVNDFFEVETVQTSGNSSNRSSTFSGSLSYDNTIDIAKIYTLTVPDQFNDDSSAFRYDYEYAEDLQSASKCSVSLSALNGFTNAEDLINQMIGYYSNSAPSNVQTAQLAGQTWYWFSRNGASNQEFDYATTNDGKVYLLEYVVTTNDEAPGCAEFRAQILDSLQKA